MSLDSIPFWIRLLALAMLMTGAALVDFVRRRDQATRWKEYLFLWGVAGVAALCGAANDAMTVWISPDYFVLGKGLSAEGVRIGAVALGAKAGFSAGAAAAAVCLYAASAGRRYPPLELSRWVRLSWRPFVTAPAGAVLVFLSRDAFHSLRVVRDLTEVIGPERTAAFVRVWAVHAGVYAGLAAGLVWMLIEMVRYRKRGLR